MRAAVASCNAYLIDRQGVVRHIHPGDKHEKGDPGYQRMQADIEALLLE